MIMVVDPDGRDIWDFVSLVGSGRNIFNGIKDGDNVTLAIGVVGLVADVATLGESSIEKGIIKSGVKEVTKEVAEKEVKQVVKNEVKQEIAETSREARREVMRKENIPTSQQPKSQSKNSSGREYTSEPQKKGVVHRQSQYNNKRKIEVIKIDLIGKQERLKQIM